MAPCYDEGNSRSDLDRVEIVANDKSMICDFNKNSRDNIYGKQESNEKARDSPPARPTSGVINFVRLWIFLLFALWCAASLSGVGSSAIVLAVLTLTAFLGSGFFLSMSFSELSQSKLLVNFLQSLHERYSAQMDVARGLLIITCLPLFLMYISISFVNQCVRKTIYTSKARNCKDGNEYSGWLTKKTAEHLRELKKWDRCKVFTIAMNWGVMFMVMVVIVTKFTVIFLSWLIGKTQSMSLMTTSFFMLGVGLIMFLLPAVPGVPIYLTFGIVIMASGREIFGILGAAIYCAVIALILKLFGSVLQQKLIGGSMSNYVRVRTLVGVNSNLIRAARIILSEPGLSRAKVAILIGGPNWPTSVLCGIMRLGLMQILVGNLSAIFIIIPTTLTGSFAYLASLKTDGKSDFPWASTAGAICTAITAVVLFSAMSVAAYYLKQTASAREKELKQLPYDEEVRMAEHKVANRNIIHSEVTQWKLVPAWAKSILILSLGAMTTCCYMVQLFPSWRFVEYELTDSIGENLGGKVTSLVLPMGWVVISLFCTSCLLLFIFNNWANRETKKTMKKRDSLFNQRSVSNIYQ